MTLGTNPFDDETPGGTNPFDDVAPSAMTMNSSTNPFYDDDDDDDTPEEDASTLLLDDEVAAPTGAPVEASWQYLGDLPYRRVPVYNNVQWGGGSSQKNTLSYGLSAFPKTALQRHPEMLNPAELQELLTTSTITKVVGCRYGGPLAAVTLPIVGETSWFRQTEIRILTNSGQPLANIEFPLTGMEPQYTPRAD